MATSSKKEEVLMGAAEEHQHVLFLIVEDDEHGYLLHKIDTKDLFFDSASATRPRGRGHGATSCSSRDKTRRLPAPIALFERLADVPERIDFARGGSTLIGLSNRRRTVVHDTAASGASSAGPEQTHSKPGGTFPVPLPLPLGGLLSLRRRPGFGGEAPFAEVLPAGDVAGAGGWRALPDPPPEFCSLTRTKPGCHVTTCVAAGERLWVSAADRGTYSLSLDATCAAWRKEGDWELPFHGRGLFVPELGAGLCFGLCPRTGRLCACDITQSPPAVRYAWDETMPRWLPHVAGLGTVSSVARFPEGSLAYLGHGRFCIAWTLGLNHRATIIRRAVHLMGVKVNSGSDGRLRLVQHKVCFYELPSHAQMAYALHAHPDAPPTGCNQR